MQTHDAQSLYVRIIRILSPVFIFLLGGLGYLLVNIKRERELVARFIRETVIGKTELRVFGVQTLELEGHKLGEKYMLSIHHAPIHDYMPFLAGAVLLLLCSLLVLLYKLSKRKGNRG